MHGPSYFSKEKAILLDIVSVTCQNVVIFSPTFVYSMYVNSLRRPSRKMYWGGQGISLKIEQANMDGSARKTLVRSGIMFVSSLAMDYQNRLLYWCDEGVNKIERVDLQGNNRVVVLDLSSDFTRPFGLALFGGAIFWSGWNDTNVFKYNLTTSQKEVIVHGMGMPMGLHIYDKSKDFFG